MHCALERQCSNSFSFLTAFNSILTTPANAQLANSSVSVLKLGILSLESELGIFSLVLVLVGRAGAGPILGSGVGVIWAKSKVCCLRSWGPSLPSVIVASSSELKLAAQIASTER